MSTGNMHPWKHISHACMQWMHPCRNSPSLAIDGFNNRAWHYKNNHVTKTSSHFVGQKKTRLVAFHLSFGIQIKVKSNIMPSQVKHSQTLLLFEVVAS